MILRKAIAGVILFFSTIPVFAQVVDDSTKVIYGTNTTKLYYQDFLYREKRTFFQKDTFYIRKTPGVNVNFNLSNYKRPVLTTQAELDMMRKADSTRKAQEDSVIKADKTPTYYKKPGKDSTSIAVYKRFMAQKKHRDDSIIQADPWKVRLIRFFRNNYDYGKPDTAITDFHNYSHVYIKNNIYQNLGILGTPNKPVFYVQPENLGYQSGFNSYDLYFTDPAKIPYYDTKSVYSRIEYVNSTGGEDRIKATISRNITRRWNVGFSYQRLNSNKQLNVVSQTNRGLATSQDFKIFTSFRSKNERYHFMGSFNYFVHRVNEQGGLKPTGLSTSGGTETLLTNEVPSNVASWPIWLNATRSDLAVWLTQGNIFSRDRRVAYHIYHQYDVLPAGKLSVFHEFDRRNQKFRYEDPTIATNTTGVSGSDFYKSDIQINDTTYRAWRNDSTYTRFNQEFAFTTNKIGAKTTNEKYTLIGYYKNRNIFSGPNLTMIKFSELFTSPFSSFKTFFINDPQTNIHITENYFGGELIYRFNGDSVFLHLKAEGMLNLINSSTLSDAKNYITYKGDHSLSAYFKYYNFEAGINRVLSAPSFLQVSSMDHNNFSWLNNMSGTQSTRLHANYRLESKHHSLSFTPSLTFLSRYIYYDALSMPQQLPWGQNILLSTLELDYKTYLGIFHLDLYARYTRKNENVADVIRFPALYANPKLYLSIVPKKKIGKQQFLFGLDFHYRSAYYGDAYMPAISQFHLQNDFLLESYLLADLFLTAKIRNATFSARINQVNQMVQLSNGYYITPYYPGTLPVLVLNIRWMLFD